MSLPDVKPGEFAEFFRSLHGEEIPPFDWQSRLAAQVAEDGGWPCVLDLPTGSGKTATIDIALFHLALEATKRHERQAPVRIAFVVDRRVIVDAAFDRADQIAKRLEEALRTEDSRSVLNRVAQRLSALAGGGPPLVVRALRGGVPRENDWARTPSQPTVLCSTVDQIGSRLLFRGYGVSDSMKPVHAGLIGSDCLILLDEAHLSEPFRQTLEAVERYRRPPWTTHRPAPWAFNTLSATPGLSGKKRFSLTADERNDRRLAPRLTASKPARLVQAKARTTQPAAHATALVDQAWAFAEPESTDGPSRLVAIIVNRVALARKCHHEIHRRLREIDSSAEAILFIGRSRDVDREALMNRYKSQLVLGRKAPDRTLFIVATQSIEAGADFDFDALVTQIAPLDALRQRFGRLNRIGRPDPAPAAIVACPDEISSRADDPLYGTHAMETWDWLVERAEKDVIDFGVNTMDACLAGEDVKKVTRLVTKKADAPIVMPAYVDLWAQTHPIPAADPEPALFLHGAPDAADVQIVWRADISSYEIEDSGRREKLLNLLSLMPPRSSESLAVPIRAARAWLTRAAALPVNDVEGAPQPEMGQSGGRSIPAFRWRGAESEESRSVRAQEIRPGDVIIVSGTHGGCDDFGWNPESPEPVTDAALRAAFPFRSRRFAFPIHRALLESESRRTAREAGTPLVSGDNVWRRIESVVRDTRNGMNAMDAARALASMDGLPPLWKQALDAISSVRNSKDVSATFPYDSGEAESAKGMILIARHGVPTSRPFDAAGTGEPTTETDDAGSFMPRKVPLTTHAKDVAEQAERFAQAAGLPEKLASAVATAAYLHDEGKSDPRFQLYLRHGDRLMFELDSSVLAKSDVGYMGPQLDSLIRRRCELPDRWRHEASSVVRSLTDARFLSADDKRLVLWLIGTHHGYGRPLYPHTDPTSTGPQDLDFQFDGLDWPQLFTSLLRQYGAWELARMEAIVRLADHRASEEEARGSSQSGQLS